MSNDGFGLIQSRFLLCLASEKAHLNSGLDQTREIRVSVHLWIDSGVVHLSENEIRLFMEQRERESRRADDVNSAPTYEKLLELLDFFKRFGPFQSFVQSSLMKTPCHKAN